MEFFTTNEWMHEYIIWFDLSRENSMQWMLMSGFHADEILRGIVCTQWTTLSAMDKIFFIDKCWKYSFVTLNGWKSLHTLYCSHSIVPFQAIQSLRVVYFSPSLTHTFSLALSFFLVQKDMMNWKFAISILITLFLRFFYNRCIDGIEIVK